MALCNRPKLIFTMKKIFCFILICLILLSALPSAHSSIFDEAFIQGFSLEKIEEGKRAYSLKAEEATFGNKRIGFFSIGLIKVMNLKGVDFSLYCVGEISETKHFDEALFEINTGRLLDKKGNVIFHE